MKIQKFCTWLVVVLFIGGIFTVCIGTIVTEHAKLYGSVTDRSIYGQYRPTNATIPERIGARIQSFENSVNTYLFGREAGLSLNLAAEGALGKQIMQFGDSRMVRLNTGHLYDLQPSADVSEQLNEIVAMRDAYLADIPLLFAYAQSTLYDEAMLPEGVAALDHNMETADGILAALRAADIECIDSRQVLGDSGYALEELILYTDQHWSSKAALLMAGEIARNLQAKGLPVAAENLEFDQFDSLTYEDNFLGKYGQRIGAENVQLDDMTAYWPKYDTQMHYVAIRKSTVSIDNEGTFKDAAIRWDQFENDENRGYSTNSYKAYGLTESEQKFVNENVPEGRILVIKDSFGASVTSFLSLSAHEVWGVDMRTAQKTVKEYIDELQPDAVVIAYSQQMMRDYAYEIMED
ncbi:MAG: hypothetical protein Q4E13_07080 [Clostridia bacterium]|nr:hypothetical protein [Clostridia bacterium]